MPSGEHVLTSELLIRRPRAEVFSFFADAENLEQITPPELRFEITTELPIAMREGAVIDYRLRLFGWPTLWRTLISTWEPETRFVDEQVKGPYALWVHTHTFEETDEGTMVRDHVRYRLPLYPLGEIAYPLVRLQLRRIFAYRRRTLLERFA